MMMLIMLTMLILLVTILLIVMMDAMYVKYAKYASSNRQCDRRSNNSRTKTLGSCLGSQSAILFQIIVITSAVNPQPFSI